MTNEEIRQKAIECVSNIINNCKETTCEHCTMFEDCKQIIQSPGQFPNEIWSYEHGFADGADEGKRQATAWIPVTERLPKNEETVLITAEHRPIGGKPYRRVTKAFYEDGTMNTEDSGCCWDTSECDWEYDEESDGYIIPEGWWEDTDYCEVLGIVDDFVLAWMPLPEPFMEGSEKE